MRAGNRGQRIEHPATRVGYPEFTKAAQMSASTAHKLRPLLLWGFMGCGKSSVGRAAAERLEWPFFDLDTFIEESHGRSVAAIFADEGESYFRQLEKRALLQLLDQAQPSLIALGGGTLLNERLLERCLRDTLVVRLQASVDTILARTAGSDRPLLQGARHAEVERLLQAREALYRRAHAQVDTNGKSLHSIVNALLTIHATY